MIQDNDSTVEKKVITYAVLKQKLREEFDRQLQREVMINNTIPASWYFNFLYKKPEETEWKFDVVLVNNSITNQFEYVMNKLLDKFEVYEIAWDFPKTNEEPKLPY